MPRDWKGLTVYTREDWGVGPTRAVRDTKAKRQFVVHRSGFRGMSIDTLAEQKACMKAMYEHHTENNNWVDIGYNFVVFQPTRPGLAARVFTGRGMHALPAAQRNANAGTVAVCVVVLDEDIKDGTVDRLKSIYRRTPCTDVLGHRNLTPTECPGRALMAVLPAIRNAK